MPLEETLEEIHASIGNFANALYFMKRYTPITSLNLPLLERPVPILCSKHSKEMKERGPWKATDCDMTQIVRTVGFYLPFHCSECSLKLETNEVVAIYHTVMFNGYNFITFSRDI